MNQPCIQWYEAWWFMQNKGNKQQIWLTIDCCTREIVGVHVDDRTR